MSASARSAALRTKSARAAARPACGDPPTICHFSHSRTSVATWSLRLRPVCSLPATGPIRSVSRRSMALWISSSAAPASALCGSAAISARTASSPATIRSRSSPVSSPARAIVLAQASEPVISASHSRQSKGSDALKRTMSGSFAALNRPPHSGAIRSLPIDTDSTHRTIKKIELPTLRKSWQLYALTRERRGCPDPGALKRRRRRELSFFTSLEKYSNMPPQESLDVRPM